MNTDFIVWFITELESIFVSDQTKCADNIRTMIKPYLDDETTGKGDGESTLTNLDVMRKWMHLEWQLLLGHFRIKQFLWLFFK